MGGGRRGGGKEGEDRTNAAGGGQGGEADLEGPPQTKVVTRLTCPRAPRGSQHAFHQHLAPRGIFGSPQVYNL